LNELTHTSCFCQSRTQTSELHDAFGVCCVILPIFRLASHVDDDFGKAVPRKGRHRFASTSFRGKIRLDESHSWIRKRSTSGRVKICCLFDGFVDNANVVSEIFSDKVLDHSSPHEAQASEHYHGWF
jgi:hypothetical protein